MTFLTNWIFWAILGTIILLMAIVGYLAEGTEFSKKKKENKKEKVEDIQTPELTNNPSAWTGEIKKEDEHHEQIHNVPSVDDWNTIPTVNNQQVAAPELPKTNQQPATFTNMNPNSLTPNAEPIINEPVTTGSSLVSELEAPVSGSQPVETLNVSPTPTDDLNAEPISITQASAVPPITNNNLNSAPIPNSSTETLNLNSAPQGQSLNAEPITKNDESIWK